MTEEQARQAMRQVATADIPLETPSADIVWAASQLEARVELRRQALRPLFWVDIALRAGLGTAALLLAAWFVALPLDS